MSARQTRDDRLAAAHAAATAPVRWTCRVDGCPDAGVWVPAFDKADAHAEADQHYAARHAAAWIAPAGFAEDRARFLGRTA